MRKEEHSDYELSGEPAEKSESFENSECIKKEKKMRLKLKKERIYKQKNHGSWTQEEEEKFVNYMKSHKEIFENKEARRSQKIFRKMSKSLLTRSSEQCRSHHQKYELRFNNFESIVEHITTKVLNYQDLPTLNLHKEFENIQLKKEPKENSPSLSLFREHFANPLAVENIKEKEKDKIKTKTKAQLESTMVASGEGFQVRKIEGKEIEFLIQLDVHKFLELDS